MPGHDTLSHVVKLQLYRPIAPLQSAAAAVTAAAASHDLGALESC